MAISQINGQKSEGTLLSWFFKAQENKGGLVPFADIWPYSKFQAINLTANNINLSQEPINKKTLLSWTLKVYESKVSVIFNFWDLKVNCYRNISFGSFTRNPSKWGDNKIVFKTLKISPFLFPPIIPNIWHVVIWRSKGTGEMKLAGDFQLPFSFFLSDHHDFPHTRVAMCYSWSSINDNFKNWIVFAPIFAYFAAKHGYLYLWLLAIEITYKWPYFESK